MTTSSQRQKGAVLIIALIFLVILTLISVVAMRASTLALRMAGNEQEHRRALQSAQSAVIGTLSQTSLQVSTVGLKSCFNFNSSTAMPSGCDATTSRTLNPGPGYGTPNIVTAKLDSLGPCPRSVGNSESGNSSFTNNGSGSYGNCAYFTVESIYDDTAARGAATSTSQGYVMLAY